MSKLKQISRHATLTSALTFAALSGLFVAATSVAHAQSAGNISGTVTDPSGAIVPGATVTLKQTETNTTRTSIADAAGLYSFTNVNPASYTLTTTSAGFAPTQITLTMTIGGNVVLNPKLTVSNSNTVVEVTSDDTANINTSTPEVSQVITATEVSQLPSLTRNPYDFVALSGNVSAGDNTSAGGVQNGANRGVSFSLNGQRNSGTEILLDGVENISIFSDAVSVIVPIDDVQEYRVITNIPPAEYGRAASGVVAVATNAGTNALHGRVWEFNRIAATTSNTVTNAQLGNPKGQYTRNQFGGAVGGPIVKDKLFFYSAAEFIRVRSGANLVAAVPSADLLAASAANIQSFFTSYGPSHVGTVISSTTNLQAGGGTTPLYSNLAAGLPLFDNVSYNAPTNAGGGIPQNTYNITGRVDYNLSAKTQAFFRYVNYHETDLAGGLFASPYSQYDVGGGNFAQTYLLSVAHEFNSANSLLTKLSFTRGTMDNTYNTALQNVPTLNLAPNGYDPYTGQTFLFPGFYSATPANGGLPYGGPQNTIQYNQDYSLTKGRHQVQIGGQLIYLQMNQAYAAYAQANEQMGKSESQGLANFPTGNLYQFQAAVNPNGATPCALDQYTGVLQQTAACTITLPATTPSFARSDRYHDWAGYGQDQFKTTDKLTLSLGVRYEHFGTQHNNHPSLDSNYYYGAGSSLPEQIRNGQVLTVPNSPNKTLWNPQWGTVSPRVGFAYDLFGNGTTSLRGGYGISYERNFGNVTFNIIQNPPNYAVVVTRPSVVTNSNTGPLGTGAGAVALPPTSLRHVDQNIRTAQTQFRSLAIDQKLGRGSILEISYNGARGVHLYDIKNYNIPGSGNLYLGDPIVDPISGKSALTSLNPKYSNDNNRGSNGDSYYDGVNVQFQTQDIRHSGLSLVANYTFAHSVDDLSTTFSENSAGNFELGYTNAFDPGLDRGSSDYDIRHRFVLAPIYRTPSFFKGSHSYLAQLLGGYQVTGIYTLRSGTPFTYYDSTNDASGYQIPRYNPVSPVMKHTFKSIPAGVTGGGQNKYQLTGPNTLPADVPFGNPALMGISDLGPYPSTMTARNIFTGPGAYNLDVSLSKTFPIHERLNLELRAEGFDVTNHHNLYIQEYQDDAASYPTPQIFASRGGVSGGANDERRFLQFAGKINF